MGARARRSSSALASSFFVALAAAAANPAVADTFEPNNTAATATSLTNGAVRVSRISTVNDLDYYRFSLAGTQHVRLDLSVPAAMDYRVILYWDDQGVLRQLVDRDIGRLGQPERLDYTAPAGTYYAVVRSGTCCTSYFSDNVDYTLLLTTPPTGDTFEPNERPSDAGVATLASGAARTSRVMTPNDIDYYRFTLAATQHVRLNLTVPAAMDFGVTLYWDDAGTLRKLAEQDKGRVGESERLDWTAPAGSYYVVVESGTCCTSYYSDSLDYTLLLTTPPPGDTFEPNERPSDPGVVNLTSGVPRVSKIMTPNDVDYYRFTLLQTQHVRLNLSVPATMDYLVELYWDDQGTLRRVTEKDIGRLGENEQLDWTAPAGTYYAIVKTGTCCTSYYTDVSDYTLRLTTPTPGDAFEPSERYSDDGVVPLIPGAARSARIMTPNDVDHFRFTLTAASQIRLDLTVPATVDYGVALYQLSQGSLQFVTSKDTGRVGESERLDWSATAGTYYALVESGTCCTQYFNDASDYNLLLTGPPAAPFVVTVSKLGGGTGTVTSSAPGISCGVDCSESYSEGVAVTLSAAPGPGSVFAGWGGACSGLGTCVLSIASSPSVTAMFQPETTTYVRYLAEGATSAVFDTRLALLNPGGADTIAEIAYLRAGAQPATTQVAVPAHRRVTVDPKTVLGTGTSEFSTTITSDQLLIVDRTMQWAYGQGYGAHAETAVEAPALTWYLAEGATHSGLELFYLLQNPNASNADVRVRYLRPSGAPLEKTYVLPAQSRTNIWVDTEDFAGLGLALANTDVSAVIEVLNGKPIIVERAVYAPVPGQIFGAGHESAGVTAPALEWFLAEGATGPYLDLFVLIANPGAMPAEVEATYLLPDGTTVVKPYTVGANSRYSIWVDYDDARLADTAVSTTVRSTNSVPVIVERAMWWPDGGWFEAHNSPGATTTGVAWALAEGEVDATRGMDTYILVANTSNTSASVKVTLYFEDGSSAERTFDGILARSRFNVAVAAEFPQAAGKRFGAVIESLGPSPAQIVVERAMYWNSGSQVWAAGTNALGTRLR